MKWKQIADYPGSPYEVGKVIEIFDGDNSVTREQADFYNKYPHIFQPLFASSPSGSEAWVSVEDRLPTISDTCPELYNEVATLQLGSKRPKMMQYWQVKDSPFVKYWISFPQPPIK